MSSKIEFTKELGGTLLIIFNGYSYEVSRCDSYYVVMPDKESPELSLNDEKTLIELYKNSNCALR